MQSEQSTLIDYPSIDKHWMKYYKDTLHIRKRFEKFEMWKGILVIRGKGK